MTTTSYRQDDNVQIVKIKLDLENQLGKWRNIFFQSLVEITKKSLLLAKMY